MTVEAFMEEAHERWPCNPWPKGDFRCIDLLGFVDLSMWSGKKIHIDGVLVPLEERGRGQGTAMLKMLNALADKHGVEMVGHISPFGFDGLKYRQLAAWYKRHGWKVDRYGAMRRMPAPPQKSPVQGHNGPAGLASTAGTG